MGWSSSKVLELSSYLKKISVEPLFEAGETVGRGFADIGYEEFLVLPNKRLLSLYAGTLSALEISHAHHFFVIPDEQQLLGLYEVHSVVVERCSFLRSRRTWEVTIEFPSGERKVAEGAHLKELLLSLLLMAVLGAVPAVQRSLRVE
jgi:hypothetical protein